MFKIQDLRDRKRIRWPVYIFIGLVIISFIFFYGWNTTHDTQQGPERFGKLRSDSLNPLEGWEDITPGEVRLAQERVTQIKQSLMPAQLRQMMARQPRAFERLVSIEESITEAANGILMEREAERLGLAVSRQEVIEELKMIPGMNDATFQQFANQLYGVSPTEAIEIIRYQDVLQRLRQIKSLTAHASLFELWQEYSLINEELTLQLAAFPAEAFEDEVELTEEELETYLAENMDQFTKPAQRRYGYATISAADLRATIDPTQEELMSHYQANSADYRDEAAVRVQELFIPVLADESTTRAVAVLSDAATSAAATADWKPLADDLNAGLEDISVFSRTTSWLERDSASRSASYFDAVMALDADQVSSPIVESNGVYLTRISERREAGLKPFEEVRDQVRRAYVAEQVTVELEKVEEQWENTADRFNSIGAFAEAVGVEDQVTSLVEARTTTIPGVGSFFQDRAYVWNQIQPNELSAVIPIGDDRLLVLEIIEEREAYDPPLADVREEVDAALRRERALEVAKATAEQSLALLEVGADFATALADAPIAPFDTPPMSRLDTVSQLQAPLIDFNRKTFGVGEGATGLNAYGRAEQPLGYAIWRINSLTPASREEFAEQRREFQEQYLSIQRQALLREWLADQRRNADFQISEEF